MRNLKFNLSGFKHTLSGTRSYRISQSNASYYFFKNEYRSLNKTSEGDLIFPCTDTKTLESVLHNRLLKIKEFIVKEDTSVSISASSAACLYFASECRSNITYDSNENVIVPGYSSGEKKLIK